MGNLRHERSAGGVLLIPIGERLLVPLITVPGTEVVGLPKGRLERGETRVEAAIREVREEAGLTGMVIETLGTISYKFWAQSEKSRVSKSVEFFLMLYRAGSPSKFADAEVDNVRLVPIEEAEALITHSGEQAILRAARRRVRDLSADGWMAVTDRPARARLGTAVA
ncbi:MAG: NUDIX domain-containing protein [Actinomycetota bacterium]|nr:NUDIX domain-containing protein [Actinomycetota bacterium]